jgi:hypothetical protein
MVDLKWDLVFASLAQNQPGITVSRQCSAPGHLKETQDRMAQHDAELAGDLKAALEKNGQHSPNHIRMIVIETLVTVIRPPVL